MTPRTWAEAEAAEELAVWMAKPTVAVRTQQPYPGGTGSGLWMRCLAIRQRLTRRATPVFCENQRVWTGGRQKGRFAGTPLTVAVPSLRFLQVPPIDLQAPRPEPAPRGIEALPTADDVYGILTRND